MTRLPRWLPWALVVLECVIGAAEVVVSHGNTTNAGKPVDLLYWLNQGVVFLEPATFTVAGVFVLTRRPGNPVGWLMVLVGISFTFGTFTSDYPGVGAHTHRPTRPFGDAVAWLSTWDFSVYLAALLVLLLLFPTGTLPSRRWAPVLWSGLVGWIGFGVIAAVQSGRIDAIDQPMNNPLGIVSVPGVLEGACTALALGALAAAVLSVLLRFRTARGDVRQQLKWFTYGAGVAIPFDIATIVTGAYGEPLGLFSLFMTTAVPVSIGVAIVQYRLYDIDVLINRTLVYGALTATLGVLYLGEVLGLQWLLRTITGHRPDIAIALSTLIIAALVQPLRRRIQAAIDRRFYRRKYDAVLTLAAFGTRLRDEVRPDQLTGDLLGVVQETVQPSHLSLWLRR